MKGSSLINDLTPENRDDRNGDFTGDLIGLRLVFHALCFILYFIAICKYFHATCGVRISKGPAPGLSELRNRWRYNRQSNLGVASCIGLRDQSHVAEAFWG